MAGDFEHRIVYRKDERGVIMDSAVVGPDDDVPEGFEDSAEYQTYVPSETEAPPVDESKLTTWEGVDLSQTVDAIKNTAEEQEGPTDPAGLRDSGEIKGKSKATVEGTVTPTDTVVETDDGSAEHDSSKTVDEVKDEADQQEGPTDPRGESSEKDDEGDDKSTSRRSRSKS
jgi:hypothetical protein